MRPTQDFSAEGGSANRCGGEERAVPWLDEFLRRAKRLLLGLSPGGVYHASRVALGPVVFYTAVSP